MSEFCWDYTQTIDPRKHNIKTWHKPGREPSNRNILSVDIIRRVYLRMWDNPKSAVLGQVVKVQLRSER